MFLKCRRFIVLSGVILPALLPAHRPRATERASADPVTVFEDRVAGYVALHRQCAERLLIRGVQPESSGGAAFREALGDSIRSARQRAQPGDILCPALASRILQIVRTDLAARERLERQAILDSVPQLKVRVNDCYPSGEPLATMPPALLLRLPPLSPELQYRFIGRTLILLDVDASLVVDVLQDALPRHA
jgi:hypothetical protein